MILKQDESGKGYLKDKVFEKKEALLREAVKNVLAEFVR